MFPKDKDKTKPPAQRPVVPRLAQNTGFVRSPATPRTNNAPHLSSPTSSNSPTNRRPVSVPSAPRIARSGKPETSATPVKAIVNGNVTPRSSARTSKIGSASSTPRLIGTSSEESGRSGADGEAKPTALGESFFHASDAPPQSPPRRPALLKQASSFIYANGSQDESKSPDAKGSRSTDHPDEHPGMTSWLEKTPSSSIATSMTPAVSRPTSAVSAPVAMHVAASMSPRSPTAGSPTKSNFHLSYRKGVSQIIRYEDSQQSIHGVPSQQSAHAPIESRRRQSSLDTISEPANEGRDRSGTAESYTTSRTAYGAQTSSTHAVEPQNATVVSTPPKSPVSPEAASPRFRNHSISSHSLSGVLSPLTEEDKNDKQMEAQQSMAAKARQERKVLDLEISNSSLLAINRSLERELRKQKVELRRFRRLSRNPNRSSWLSDSTSPMDAEDNDEYPMGSEEDETEHMENDDISDEDSGPEESMTPSALAEHDARHLAKDEERLRLDLSKHKELLVDSQKMNLSLRRCLGITEQLIKDGKRALEFEVTVADVPFGGRVLSPEELEMKAGLQEEADSYFMNNWSKESERLSAVSQHLLAESDVGTDRDSGVDLEYSKKFHEANGPKLEST